MRVAYVVEPAGREPVTFTVDTARPASGRALPIVAPAWTSLEAGRCDGCALPADATHCPAALDLVPLVEALRDLASVERATVRARLPDREVTKETDLQEAVRSFVGLVLASSGCPALRRMKPLAELHQPFASFEETLFRAVSLHLVRAWFAHQDGQAPDLELAALRAHYEEVARINTSLAQRIRALGRGDAGVNGLIQLFSIGVLVSDELEQQLAVLRELVHAT